MSFFWILSGVLFIFAGSQLYWFLRARSLARRVIKAKRTRILLGTIVLAAYLLLLALNFGWLGRREVSTHLTLYNVLVEAPFAWWVASSMLGFLIAALLWPVDRTVRWFARRIRPASGSPEVVPSRRHFLEHATTAVVCAPFVAGAYGLFYGRLNLETSHQRIRLARLPNAFQGFRIVQLSDIHIGPFMTEDEIRNYVRIANALRGDLIALTGDFVTWDPSTQQAVVRALSGLKAPYGVFGCLGNHEAWSNTEDSITRMFAQTGIRILRQENVAVTSRGDRINLIGVDYRSRRRPATPQSKHLVREYLEGVESLVARDTANILMSHNPDTFDRAAELGIDLSLAGHTHGGQVALEFISPEIAPSRLVTPYVSGLFQKPGGQLYVNRGIGTIGVPMRVGAPPEITTYELVRAG